MIHECNIHCRTMATTTAESLGIEDPGKWMPLVLTLSNIYAAKLTSDDIDDELYGCTTVFCYDGDTFIIDTPYNDFKEIYKTYINQ